MRPSPPDGSGLSSLPVKLNLGCGRDHRPDCLNLDLAPEVEPDLVHDLDVYPYPLPRGHFTTIYVLDVIEHVADVAAFMEEVHALLAPDGVVEITTPHFSAANAFTDPTHRRQLGMFSFDFFTAGNPLSYYSRVRFELAERILVFYPTLLSRLVTPLANRHPQAYERRFAWIFPAWFMIFRLRAIAAKNSENAGTPENAEAGAEVPAV